MAIPKTLGIETEYGIVHRGTDEPNPITASALLINAFLAAEGYRLAFTARNRKRLDGFEAEIPGGKGYEYDVQDVEHYIASKEAAKSKPIPN